DKKVLLFETHTAMWWPFATVYWAGLGKTPFLDAYDYPTHGHDTHNHAFCDGHVESNRRGLDSWAYWKWDWEW
ncbi:MAG: hypothetical protein GY851_23790, partial [bacterium]|nr:hypothetical protein [bacterium]